VVEANRQQVNTERHKQQWAGSTHSSSIMCGGSAGCLCLWQQRQVGAGDLIGDLGLQPDDLSVMPWRALPLGVGVLPAAQRRTAAAEGGAAVAVVVEGSTQQHASTAPAAAKTCSRQTGKSSS
jgi:hypothetical protein